MNLRQFLFTGLSAVFGFGVHQLTCPAVSAADRDGAKSLPRVVLLGDSIRMNYQQAATQGLEGKARVWAPKENCRHTFFVLESLERWLNEAGGDAAVIHINVGLHDMFLDGKTGEPRHELATYEKNLRAIFSGLRELSEATVIFALTTRVNEENQAKSKGYQRVVRRNADVETYNAAARRIAEEFEIEVNDLPAFMDKTGVEKILRPSDGIHLSPEGCELMGAEVARVITAQLPAQD